MGLNSWQSRGGAPAPQDAPGLRAVTFVLPSAEDRGFSVRDPDGQLLRFQSRDLHRPEG